jgi:hypothetical protein
MDRFALDEAAKAAEEHSHSHAHGGRKAAAARA